MLASRNTLGTPKGRIHLMVQDKRSHVHAFKTSSQTMTDYCKRHDIPISTFSHWVSKYGKKVAEAFIPAQVPSTLSSQKAPVNQKAAAHVIEIHHGDLKAVLPMMDVVMAVEIIRGVFSCN